MINSMMMYITTRRTGRLRVALTPPMYLSVALAKVRLNQPKKPFWCSSSPLCAGFSSVAHSAGVRISATSTDSNMADTMVSEN